MEEKIFTKEYQLELVDGDTEGEAEAAIANNRQFNYLKFILTDDKPNANKQCVPQDEFNNLISSGHFAPIKMASGTYKDGHEDSFPLGVITHLKEDDHTIRGLAALWTRERPEDVEVIKKAYAEKKPLNVSWEIAYTDSEFVDDIEILRGTSLRAATIVGLPAYQGRTPIFAVASEHKEDNTLDELETLKSQLAEVQTELATAKATIAELEQLKPELDELREYKAGIEKELEVAQKLQAIREKFVAAGVEKDEAYFTANSEMLLTLSEVALDFMLQELVIAKASQKHEAETETPKVPNLPGEGVIPSDPKEIAQALKARFSRK
jgi:hypothetical protein